MFDLFAKRPLNKEGVLRDNGFSFKKEKKKTELSATFRTRNFYNTSISFPLSIYKIAIPLQVELSSQNAFIFFHF